MYGKKKEIKLSENALQKYVGHYELPGITAKVYAKEGKLYCLVPGQPDYELTSVGNNKFNMALPGYSMQFHADANGTIIAVSFVQPNGTFRAEKKK